MEVIVYEPTTKEKELFGCKIVNNFKEFAKKSDVILANRYEDELFDVRNKVYTRNLYSRDS